MVDSTEARSDSQLTQGVSKDVLWQQEAYMYLALLLKKHRVTHDMLAKRLQALGVQETQRSIATKISRGSFSFVFFLQVMQALELDVADLRGITPPQKKSKTVL